MKCGNPFALSSDSLGDGTGGFLPEHQGEHIFVPCDTPGIMEKAINKRQLSTEDSVSL